MVHKDSLLKRYKRFRNVEEEKKINQKILKRIGPVSQEELAELPIERFAFILYIIGTVSPGGTQEFSDLDENIKFLQDHPDLITLIANCIVANDFGDVRDLRILRPKGNPIAAIQQAGNNHVDLLARLSIRLGSIPSWTIDDLINDNADLYISGPFETTETKGNTTNDAISAYDERAKTTLPSDIDSIRTKLQMKRTFTEESNANAVSDLSIARKRYPTEFERVFGGDAPEAQRVVDDREYIALFSLHRCFMKDAVRVAKPLSSAFKARNFRTYFIHPSLLYPLDEDSKGLAYQQDGDWGFPMFVTSADHAGIFKYFPRYDWAMIHQEYLFPFVISEVTSQKDESDETRMLIQAMALARVGEYLMDAESKETFFMVAIYLSDDLEARRYILKPQNKEKGKGAIPVSIVKETFNLADEARASMFLLEMLNLASHMQNFSNQLDKNKIKELSDLHCAAQDMISLTTQAVAKPTDADTDWKWPPWRQKKAPFESDEVRQFLNEHGYVICFADALHSNVALVIDRTGNRPVEYLKFMEQGSKELSILQYLAEIESPHNHAVRPTGSWDMQDGTMVALPSCGIWITDLKDMTTHLWDLARQLFEGVNFLHENKVAHLDLKPHNLVIPPTYGKLTILDFNASIRLKRITSRVTGGGGTEGYMAPEIGPEPYSPIRADLYTCGVVIEEICQKASRSKERQYLLDIANRLQDEDPDCRPMMSDILGWLDKYSSKNHVDTV